MSQYRYEEFRLLVKSSFKRFEFIYFIKKVIGDKSGAFTAFAMKKRNAVETVHLLEKTAGAKVKFVHVVRNPFDNIATMVLKHKDIKARDGEHKVKV